MKRYAVAVINFYDNEMLIEFVRAETVKKAVSQHSKVKKIDLDDDTNEWMSSIPEILEEIKTYFFDGDMMIDVKEVPES